MQFQKISILSPQKGLEFPREGDGGGSRGPKLLKKCMRLAGNFQRGRESYLLGRYGYVLELHNPGKLIAY